MNCLPDHPEQVLREHAWLAALARQLVAPHEGALDLAHDTLAAAMLQPAPRIAGVRGWLAAMLRKQLAGRRRAEHRRRAREALAARADAVPATIDTVARFEVQRDVGNAVLALPEPYRTTVLLRFWEELTPAAISSRMAVPVETVRTRLKRGLQQLRERLDQVHGGDRRAWFVPLASAVQVARPVRSFVFPVVGVLLMAVRSKVLLGALAAAAVWLLAQDAWSPVDVRPPATGPGPLPVAAAAEDRGVPNERALDRVLAAAEDGAAPAGAGEAWLVVTGTVVDHATDRPLSAVAVRLVRWPARGPEVAGTTQADGTFTLREARASEQEPMQVVVLADDYAAARLDVRYDLRSEDRQVIDVGTIPLVRGTLFSGQVVDAEGRGVPDAELLLPLVSVAYQPFRGPQHMLQRTASLGHADADGRFRLDQPIAPDQNHGNLLFAVSPHGVGWGRFEASTQRRHVADLVIRLRPTGGVRVAVVDPRGRPLAGVLVRALPRFGPLGIAGRGFREPVPGPEVLASQFAGRTDALGELRLPQLPIGEVDPIHNVGGTENDYDLWLQAEGHPEQPLVPFELQPGLEQRVTVRLVAAREVAVSVAVHDDLGAPVVGATVRLGGPQTVQGHTDAAGHVDLVVGFAPKLALVASCPDHQAATALLEPGPHAEHLQATLVLARTQPFDGRVVDQAGAPAPGMHLFVDQRQVAITDAEGRFHVEAFPKGLRRVVVALGPGMDGIEWTGAQEPKHVDAAHGPATFVLQRRPGSTDVRFVVVDAVTGEALEPAAVSLRLRHEETGIYFFPKTPQSERGALMAKGAPAGRWRFEARTAAGQRGSLEFELAVGQPPVELRLALPMPGTVTGRLQFVGTEPPAAVILEVRHATARPGASQQFHFPGRWQVDASSQSVVDDQHGGTGSLCLQPVRSVAFRLESADPTDALAFQVRGEGLEGEATVRVEPGQLREVVVEVRRKGP